MFRLNVFLNPTNLESTPFMMGLMVQQTISLLALMCAMFTRIREWYALPPLISTVIWNLEYSFHSSGPRRGWAFFFPLGAFHAQTMLPSAHFTYTSHRQEEAYPRIMDLNGAVVDDRWITVADA